MATSKEIKGNLRTLIMFKGLLEELTDDKSVKLNKRMKTGDLLNLFINKLDESIKMNKNLYKEKYPTISSIDMDENDNFIIDNKIIDYISDYNTITADITEDLCDVENKLFSNLYLNNNKGLFGLWIDKHLNNNNDVDKLSIVYIWIDGTKQLNLTNDVFYKSSITNKNKYKSNTYNIKLERVKNCIASLIINNSGVNPLDENLQNIYSGRFIFNSSKEIGDYDFEYNESNSEIYNEFNSNLVIYNESDNSKLIDHLEDLVLENMKFSK